MLKDLPNKNHYQAEHIHTRYTGFIPPDQLRKYVSNYLITDHFNKDDFISHGSVCSFELSFADKYPFHFIIITHAKYEHKIKQILDRDDLKVSEKLILLKSMLKDKVKIILAHPCVIYSRMPCTWLKAFKLLKSEGLDKVIDRVEIANARTPFVLWLFFYLLYRKLKKENPNIGIFIGIDAHSLRDIVLYRHKKNEKPIKTIGEWSFKQVLFDWFKFLKLSKQGLKLILRKLRPKYEHG